MINHLVKQIIEDHVIIKKSEAEENLKKLEKFNLKSKNIENSLKAIND